MTDVPQKQKEWLKKEVLNWYEKGIVSEYQVHNILKEYDLQVEIKKQEEKPLNIVKVLGFIGAILLGLGIILFVAANWQEIPRLMKTVLLLVLTFGTLFIGFFLTHHSKDHPILGKVLIFLSALFYGGSTFLIAQMYNVNANAHWLVLFWAVSIFPVAYFLESLSTYLLVSFLFMVWDGLFNYSNWSLNNPNYYYPLIMFFVLLPLSRGSPFITYFNIVGLTFAQIYPIAHKYHWLVLVWALLLLGYYLIKKERVYSITSAFVFILWNIVYIITFKDQLPYYYLLPLAYFFYVSYKNNYVIEVVISMFGAWIWINLMWLRFTTLVLGTESHTIHFLLLQLSLGILFYCIGKFHELFEKDTIAYIYQGIGFAVITLFTYIFSFKGIQEDIIEHISSPQPYLTFILLGISILLLLVSYWKTSEELSSKCGALIVSLIIISILVLIFYPSQLVITTTLFNIAIFVIALVSIWYGFKENNLVFFNGGIFIFVVLIISRYFDIFWKLLDRSVFFIVGGLLLLLGSIFLERKRRKTIEVMAKKT